MRDEEVFTRDVRFCLENDVDYIIHSVYKGHKEIIDLKKVITQENEKIVKEARGAANEVKIVAKLENDEAIKDIEEILNVADAIMIPRGVLGTVLPIEKISWI
jgi:pyruvate kinase